MDSKVNRTELEQLVQKIHRLELQHQQQEDKEAELREKTLTVGGWSQKVQARFFRTVYFILSAQYLFLFSLVYSLTYFTNVHLLLAENPLPLTIFCLLAATFVCFSFLGFHNLTLATIILSNLMVGLLVSWGLLYTEPTFLLYNLVILSIFSLVMALLNSQNHVPYYPAGIVFLVLLVFMYSTWHLVYLPYYEEAQENSWTAPGPRLERLAATLFTSTLCSVYILYFENYAKNVYKRHQTLQAALDLYLRTLFFIYIVSQIVHLWTQKCRRCRRAADIMEEE